MEGLLDRSSPRRGSLTSLHRYPSGSFSHNTKLGSPSSTLQVNGGNLYSLCKDLDKFTRYFIVKAVQVIVQSRIGGHKLKTDCKPSGNDWFNINISDIVEVSDRTKAVLDSEGLSVKLNWRVCCEISLKTNDGSRVVLEHWIISNKSNLNSNQKLNSSGQASPKGYIPNRSSNTHLTSSNNSAGGGASPLGTINSSTSRIRTGTFTSTSRTRLNSIDDSDGETNFTTSRPLASGTNENAEIKPSTSCFTLSSPQMNINQLAEGNNLITTSPSVNSLNNNNVNTTNIIQDHQATAGSNSSTSQQQTQSTQNSTTTNKTSASSSIYTIYNRMSLLLKTLLTTTHVVPTYRLASRTSQTDSCVLCYRVYTVPRPTYRGSIEDIDSNLNHSESPNRRSLTSTCSLGSVDIREFVSPDELEHFCPILKLGSIKTDVSEIDVSVCYRTDIRNSNFIPKSFKSREMYNKMMDEDCLVAAKQLLAGNDFLRDHRMNQEHHNHSTKNGRFMNHERVESANQGTLDFLDQPLKPAFAFANVTAIENQNGKSADDAQSKNLANGCDLIESAFSSLLRTKCSPNNDDLIDVASNALTKPSVGEQQPEVVAQRDDLRANGSLKSANAQSEPIQVPKNRGRNHLEHHTSLTPGSTPKSLTDSYVFVDLNPPFASDEQNDINSFFHGPSPSFTNTSSSLRDVDELTNQLATFEANASQIDDFVDNMCASEDDEEANDENNCNAR